MKERKISSLQILFMVLCGIVLILGASKFSFADVAVGDVIDKTNWQKAQGLLPDAMLEYLQKGYLTIKVGKLNYEPADMLSDECRESLKKNHGRYSINPKGEIIDNRTGEIDPYDIMGIPFPVLDLHDPQVGLKMQVNHMYYTYGRGNVDMTATDYFVGNKMERYIRGPQLGIAFLGTAKNIAKQREAKNFGKKIETLFSMKVTDPYELNGLATMTYAYADNTPDKVFAYVPALRRTRVLSAAARSDAMFGTDYTLDDANGGFMGKSRDFNCTYIRSQDTLMRFVAPNVIDLVKNSNGTYELKGNYPSVQWGFQTAGWKGKLWASTNDIWVKQKVHIVECKAKDPYYNYGKFELWYSPDTRLYAHKIIWDRAGKRWKVMNTGNGAYMSKDRSIVQINSAFGDWIYDEQRDHATCIAEFNPKEKKIFDAILSTDSFTMGGMAKFAK